MSQSTRFVRVTASAAARTAVFLVLAAMAAGTVSGVTFAAFTGTASSAGPSVSTKRVFPGVRSTAPFDIADASGGGAASNGDSPFLATGDGRTFNSGNFANAFAAGRYVEVAFNSPLPGNIAVTSAAFNATALTPSGSICAYIQTRVTSTGTVLANYGSAGAPLGCFSPSVTYSLPLSEITSTDIANDFTLRIYAYSTNNSSLNFDSVSLAVTTALQTASLYPIRTNDSATGVATGFPWSLHAVDAAVYPSAAPWAATFSGTRRIDFMFPAYTPAAAIVSSATLTHTYRDSNGATACYYVEIWSGGLLLASHGSAIAPMCATGAAYVTDTIPLPEVNTAAEANAVTVRLFARSSGAARITQHERMSLGVSYSVV